MAMIILLAGCLDFLWELNSGLCASGGSGAVAGGAFAGSMAMT
jgi:hypothetical protein